MECGLVLMTLDFVDRCRDSTSGSWPRGSCWPRGPRHSGRARWTKHNYGTAPQAQMVSLPLVGRWLTLMT